MAKEKDKLRQDAPAVYFKSLTIENIKCFKSKSTIDLSDRNGKPAQWTVILGNNNTGKTTLLKCLAGLDAFEINTNREAIEEQYLFPFFISLTTRETIGLLQPDINISSDYNLSSEFYKLREKKQSISSGIYNSSFEDVWGKRTDDYGISGFSHKAIGNLLIFSFGASRKMSRKAISETDLNSPHSSLFNNTDIPNVEDWLLNLFVSQQLKSNGATKYLELAQKVLSSGILPDVTEVRFSSEEYESTFSNFVEFKTDFGWIRLRELGYGYQTMIAWVLDLVRRMTERYPNSLNPLAEPAIVLVDEIDLHLHPDWQRRIVAHLSLHFPNTQFIVTAHSPLIVQSAEEVNLVILKKEENQVTIEQPNIRSFKGWTIEEIMTDLMQLEGQTMSNTYLNLMQQFDDALDMDDYDKAKDAYNQLNGILHPQSSQRKLMKIQMTSLSPVEAI
jgi:predicted ATP-binding protein involved in virulence